MDGPDAGTEAGDGGCGADLEADPRSCGRCGHDCLGGACDRGGCTPVDLTDGNHVPARCAGEVAQQTSCIGGTYAGLALDETHVYFGDVSGAVAGNGAGGVLRLRKDGTAPSIPEVLATSGAVDAVALDGASVFWQQGAIARVSKGGGAVESLALSDGPAQASLFVGDGEVVWAGRAGIRRRSLAAAGDAGAEDIVPAEATGIVTTLALEGTIVCWGNQDGNVLCFDRAAGGAPRILGIQQSPAALVLKDGIVYWANHDGRVLRRSTNPAVQAVEVMGTTQVSPRAMTADATDLYIAAWGSCISEACGLNGSIHRLSRTASNEASEVLAIGVQLPSGIAVDDRAIYWTTWWVTQVRRLAK